MCSFQYKNSCRTPIPVRLKMLWIYIFKFTGKIATGQ